MSHFKRQPVLDAAHATAPGFEAGGKPVAIREQRDALHHVDRSVDALFVRHVGPELMAKFRQLSVKAAKK